ncbi:MAG: DUF4445 domain-containing protein [Phycisphaerales bacterium]|nr:DUF4445 domain-containing protein [Phycisphaerales bacterium]
MTSEGQWRWSHALRESRRGRLEIRLSPRRGEWKDHRHARHGARHRGGAPSQGRNQGRYRSAARAIRAARHRLHTICLASGFGTRINVSNAVAIGLLPQVDPLRVVPLGNTSLAGVAAVVLDAERLERMARLAGRIEPHTLGHDDDLEERCIESLRLPHAIGRSA